MKRFKLFALALFMSALPIAATAAPLTGGGDMASHKALYEIDLVATHSGSQIINIKGQMSYEWKRSCDAWLTDHHFKMYYEYADAPGMRISSDFSTYEPMDGQSFSFTSRRARDGEMYQEIRGHADLTATGGTAVYTLPEPLTYDLSKGALFPSGHTYELVNHARAGDKFYSAQVFDGSDEEGPIEINAFIGKNADAMKTIVRNPKIDESLLTGKAWNVRMAVFPLKDQEEESDYEMDMVLLANGVISDMLIEYDDFSVRQKLVALQKIPDAACGGSSPGKNP